MHTNFITAAVGIAIVGLASAHPQAARREAVLAKRVLISPDNTCGIQVDKTNTGYSCDATVNNGGCCSQ